VPFGPECLIPIAFHSVLLKQAQKLVLKRNPAVMFLLMRDVAFNLV
jgi:hypothetical protein